MHQPRPRKRIRAVAVVALSGTLTVAAAVSPLISASAATNPGTPAPPTPGVTVAAPGAWKPLAAHGADKNAGQVVPGRIVLRLAAQTGLKNLSVAGSATTDAALNAALAKANVKTLRTVAPGIVVATIDTKDVGATTRAATQLAAVPGVVAAEPDRYVGDMISGSTPLPATTVKAAAAQAKNLKALPPTTPGTPSLPSNYGLTSSLESWLNSGGVDAMGAYSDLESRYGQLPGQGEIITNVSVGDLTDQSMADAGDGYVQQNGPTSIVQNGQRYLDLPSMPLIPTYTSDASGTLNPLGSAEDEDPTDGEILLDFGVMAPLPHDLQRPSNTGSGFTDLLGIAPGASYRLVVPTQPTMDQIDVALLAAARQEPRPNVINASLGFGTDSTGFAGRYLEDDPVLQSTIATIVQQYGITVSIAANDGTRLYTPTAVGPDGGSTPTDLTRDAAKATTIDDDAASTTPSRIVDSGAIAAGGSTTDETLAGGVTGNPTVAESRISGGGDFSSGFGTRIDLSAPSDNIPSFEHDGDTAQSVSVVLTGGTSAAAPEIAAAAAVVDQAARLTGRTLTPAQLRTLLERTARPVATPAQIDRTLQVGPQVDVTAAVESLLPRAKGGHGPQIVRLGVAHHVSLSNLGGTFTEYTDPSAIDVAGPVTDNGTATGQGLVGPVTFAADVTNAGRDAQYRLTVGTTTWKSDTPSIRVTPTQLLAAAKLPVVSTTPRTILVGFTVLASGSKPVTVTRPLTISASDGTYSEALPPTVSSVVKAGQSVVVHYDLTGVRYVGKPTLAVSALGHWNPVLAPIFNVAWSAPLTGPTGSVTVPASAFAAGGGIYGVGIIQNDSAPAQPLYGEFAPVRVDGSTADQRPDAPTLAAVGQQLGHGAEVTREYPAFSLHYNVDSIDGAYGAMLEISAPAPTLFNSLNTFVNQDGTARDANGFDSGSVVYQALPAKAGTVKLDALKLGLATSVQYNVRVVPVGRKGNVVGQASPSSALVVDDGLVPGDGSVLDFASKGADSVASVVGVTGTTGASVRRYDPATGAYGAVVTSDPDPDAEYSVIGVDTVAGTVLVAHWTDSDSKDLEVWNLAAGTEVGTPVTLASSQYDVLAARVDSTRHRAALLAWTATGADELLPFDMTAGTLGTAIPLDAAAKQPGGRFFDTLDIDQSTGVFQAAHFGGGSFCIGGASAQVVNVDLGTSTATAAPSSTSKCGVGFASAQDGSTGWMLTEHGFSINFPPTTGLLGYTEKSLAYTSTYTLRQESPLTMAVDSTHQVAVVAYGTPLGHVVYGSPFPITSDSNAMSQLDIVDLTTGKVLKTLSTFNYLYAYSAGNPLGTFGAGIQLDPTTRTGWTYAPNGSQIQAFNY